MEPGTSNARRRDRLNDGPLLRRCLTSRAERRLPGALSCPGRHLIFADRERNPRIGWQVRRVPTFAPRIDCGPAGEPSEAEPSEAEPSEAASCHAGRQADRIA